MAHTYNPLLLPLIVANTNINYSDAAIKHRLLVGINHVNVRPCFPVTGEQVSTAVHLSVVTD